MTDLPNIAVMGCFGGTGDRGGVGLSILSNGAVLTTFTDV